MLVIGSRGSQLALWQANYVRDLLGRAGIESSIEVIRTSGDKLQNVPLSITGTKDLFTKEIEEALLEGRVDLAVHSLKDLTVFLPEGLVLAASPERADPRDAVAGIPLASLPNGARVGTSSIRRAAQLRSIRPDLAIGPIRGNVDTRLRKLDAGEWDSLLLAKAGLERLGLGHRVVETLSVESMCPAPGQGALGIETKPGSTGFEAAQVFNHAETWTAITAERAVLEALGGGCQLPAGAFAQVSGQTVELTAMVIDPNGKTIIRQSARGTAGQARALGLQVGAQLLESGANKILQEVYPNSR